jgi:hypothetical protein
MCEEMDAEMRGVGQVVGGVGVVGTGQKKRGGAEVSSPAIAHAKKWGRPEDRL